MNREGTHHVARARSSMCGRRRALRLGLSLSVLLPGAGCRHDLDVFFLDAEATDASDATPDLPPATGLTAERIAAGFAHSCARLVGTEGRVRCWGLNRNNNLGFPASGPSCEDPRSPGNALPCEPRALDVQGVNGVVALHGGFDHTCARLSMGTVACWGENLFGQLGLGHTDMPAPGAMVPEATGLANVQQIAVGATHNCALLQNATVMCWGENEARQVSSAGSLVEPTPTVVSGLTDIAQVAVGDEHSCARTRAGRVLCWGDNRFNQLGYPAVEQCSTPGGNQRPCSGTPGEPRGLAGRTATDLVLGGHHTCARVDGVYLCWGSNEAGQLGHSTTNATCMDVRQDPVVTVPCTETPQAVDVVDTSADVAEVISGSQAKHACARYRAGTVACWGLNTSGQLGMGHQMPVTTAQTIPGLAFVSAVVLGAEHTCVTMINNAVYCWGANAFAQVGNGSSTPPEVTSPTSVLP